MAGVVIYNAKIYIARNHFEEAVYIENGRIQAIGSNTLIRHAAPYTAALYDAYGRTVVPGFHDSHLHVQKVGEQLGCVRLFDAKSISDVQERCKDYILQHAPHPGDVVHGMGWNQDLFVDEPRLLTCHDLDDVSMERPIVLERVCTHLTVANTCAMRLAGITADTPAADGGQIDRDQDGRLTGVFRENACEQILRILPQPSKAHLMRTIRLAMEHALAYGITSVQTMDLYPDDWRTMWDAYRDVLTRDPWLRVRQQCNFMTPERFAAFLESGFYAGMGDAFLRVGPLKLFVDGSLGARTALLRQPYRDDLSTCGLQTLTSHQLDALLRMAKQNGFQTIVHAIGDGAIAQVIDCYKRLYENGDNPLRCGVVHCQITDTELLNALCASGLITMVQPIFLNYDVTIAESRVGRELASTSYAFGSMKRKGVHMSFGTDSPVEDMNPMENIYCAVTRKRLNGAGESSFFPDECLDIYDAVDAYTAESAYAAFEEAEKGRLLPGFFADLAILDRDIFTVSPEALRTTRVDATMVNGKFVYKRSG